MVFHTEEEQDEVGEHIAANLGIASDGEDFFLKIKRHHEALVEIQRGRHPKFPKIVGVRFPDKTRKHITKSWKLIKEEMDSGKSVLWYRELNDGFRMAMASSLLHVNERKIIDNGDGTGIIVPNDFDMKLAGSLMVESMALKWQILNTNVLRKVMIKNNKLMKDAPWTEEDFSDKAWEKKKEDLFG